jgi:spectinomycin phosphotransferase/16S rRNA (guanine(1405)-N(7))-methyltransferase
VVGVLSPPADVGEDLLASALAREWGLTARSLTYRPLGFGSHHWEATDAGGQRWWVTVDDLDAKRASCRQSRDAAFERLRASLAASVALRAHGHAFAVAPIPATDGRCLARLDDRYAVAVYPNVSGRRFAWGEFSSPEHRWATLDMVVAVHAAPAAVRDAVARDDFAVPHLDDLTSTLDSVGPAPVDGPYADAAAELVRAQERPIRAHLARYDDLVASARERPDRSVLTHGEPHPGNTMHTADGWVLIDWDTALAAPPERDLWLIDPGDGSVLSAYAEATGVAPLASVVELYRLRWILADIAVEVGRFRRPHDGGPNDVAAWEILTANVEALGRPA